MPDMRVKAYYKDETGKVEDQLLFEVDANYAVASFPTQWAFTSDGHKSAEAPADPPASGRRRGAGSGQDAGPASPDA